MKIKQHDENMPMVTQQFQLY